MIIKLDRAKKITLLRWLQRGEINTDDIAEIPRFSEVLTPKQAKELIEHLEKTY